MKGTAGFGDRLQCLLQVMWYADATKRCLVLDWRDGEWSGPDHESFDEFFKIREIDTFSIKDFLSLYEWQAGGLTTTPPIWQSRMQDPNLKDYVYKELFSGAKHGELFGQIAKLEANDFTEDVVVYCGTGFRGFRYSDFKKLELRPMVSMNLKSYLLHKNLNWGKYNLIHLRAGSKKWAGGKVKLKDLAEKIDNQFPDANSYFKHLRESWIAKVSETDRNSLPTFVVSDSRSVAEQWISFSGIGTYLDHSMQDVSVASGIHEAGASLLSRNGVTRTQLNYEAIRDFATIMGAANVVSDGVSLFSKMAVACREHANDSWRLQK